MINEKRADANRESEELLKSVTTNEMLSPENTKYRETTDISRPILITDDDKNMCEVLADIIEGQFEGLSIETANDGEEALQYINQHSPSLLILDLKMPRKNGFEVLKELSNRSEMFPILVLSSDPRPKEEVVEQAHISGDRFEYMQKTFNIKEFIDTIKKMISQQ